MVCSSILCFPSLVVSDGEQVLCIELTSEQKASALRTSWKILWSQSLPGPLYSSWAPLGQYFSISCEGEKIGAFAICFNQSG